MKSAEKVTNIFGKIENAVVNGYEKVENVVVEGYDRIEDAFVDRYLTRDGETVRDAKARLKEERKQRENGGLSR